MGLANQVLAGESLKAETEGLISRLAAGPTLAFGGVKRLLMTAPSSSLESHMKQETQEIVPGQVLDVRSSSRALCARPHELSAEAFRERGWRSAAGPPLHRPNRFT